MRVISSPHSSPARWKAAALASTNALAGVISPRAGRTDDGAIGVQPRLPGALARPGEVGSGAMSQAEEVVGVGFGGIDKLASDFELLAREGANGLEQVETRVLLVGGVGAHQAL